MRRFVVGLRDVDGLPVELVGGKAAALGALTRIDDVPVPDGFCVTTDAFRSALEQDPSIAALIDRLSAADAGDLDEIRSVATRLRATIGSIAVPEQVATAIGDALTGLGGTTAPGEDTALGEETSWAVRSSATAEDLPHLSFAGQHDSFLGVVGEAAILHHVRRCWASLFTERAVIYRRRNGIDDRLVRMAVVVQRMVPAVASGVLFTADPVTFHRRIATVEAVAGLGEALVSGLVTPDVLTVRDGQVVAGRGGSADPASQAQPVLTDAQALRLVALGRRIEAWFGRPQDIEWCLVDDGFRIVQSRPITTLFPVPEARDTQFHVYVSVGHQQMMTDPMTPLGLSFWQLTTPAPMAEAGGRLFVDVTQRLASPAARAGLLEAMERADPLTGDALRTVLSRDDVPRPLPDDAPPGPLFGAPSDPVPTDPSVVTGLIAESERSVAACRIAISGLAGEALLTFIRDDLQELRRVLFDRTSHQVFLSAMEAVWWLNDHLQEWLGEPNVADVLTRSVPHNITSEMGLALLDVADVIRRHPQVVAFLETVEDDALLDRLPSLAGGPEARDAIASWLDRYGMRCVGEIDITRPRWAEQPSALVPLLLGNVRNFAPGEAARRFAQGLAEAEEKEREVLARLRSLPDGTQKAEETKQRIDRVRTFIGYREYPKYGMVSRYFVYKQALVHEAERLAADGVLRAPDDLFFLTFDELEDVVRTRRVDDQLVDRRRKAFRSFGALTPPRVLTSDGEALVGTYRRDDVPEGALSGLAVSAGTVEGRARVVRDLAQARLEPGDILVTPHTDPSWTPLFVTAAGLVTEVGGLMTHGAVIAREYGLPAVVGVLDATRLIADGRRIRLHGTAGYVELLP